jgi:hypothetical protein
MEHMANVMCGRHGCSEPATHHLDCPCGRRVARCGVHGGLLGADRALTFHVKINGCPQWQVAPAEELR